MQKAKYKGTKIMNWMEILGWDENNLEDIRFVGYSYLKEGKYEIATNFFKALNVLSPNSWYDLQALGNLFLQQGQSLEALNYIDQSLKLNPRHAPTLLNRVKALFLLGYNKQAISQAQILLRCKNRTVASQAKALISSYS
jgi:tetratricopeptide (TPR) repeat protein